MSRMRLAFIVALTCMPLIAEAASAPKTFKDFADQVFTILIAGVATLVALGLVIYLWNIAFNMRKLSEGEPAQAYRSYIVWGVVILFVMVSIVGIVRLISETLFQGTPPGYSLIHDTSRV